MTTLLPSEHWDYRFGDAVRGLRAALEFHPETALEPISILGLGSCVPVRSARAAIAIALKALALPPGARIGVPLYCCPVVFKAIETAGCRPHFIDVDTDTYCMSVDDLFLKRSEIDAVVPAHMFGNLCNMPELQDAASGIPFIEDCAQALGSRLNGDLAGSFGEISALSFRSGKYLSVGEGGALFSKRDEYMTRLVELVADLPGTSRWEECVHVAKTYLRSQLRSRPLWGLLGVRLWKLYNQKVNYTSKSPVVLDQTYRTDWATTIRRLPLLDSWIAGQRRNAEHYAQHLRVNPEMLCSERRGTFYNRLQYPILTENPEQCDQLVEHLYRNKISTARPYKEIAEVAAAHYGYTGDCPQAERIAKTVLVIPCNHTLKSTDIEKVTNCVNDAWTQISGPKTRKSSSSKSVDGATVPV